MTGPPDQASRGDTSVTRTAVVGGSVVALLAVGWFVLSHFVMDTSTSDAIGEAFGVAFALLVVASMIGAVVSGRGDSR